MSDHDIAVRPTRTLRGDAGWSYECTCGKATHHFKSPEAAQRAGQEHADAKAGGA